MSRKAIGSAALASVALIRTAAAVMIARRIVILPLVSPSPRPSRGEGRGEGLSRRTVLEELALIINSTLIPRILRRFPSRHPAEHAADGHADAGRIALAEHVAGHDLAGGEHIGGGLAVLHHHPRLPVHAGAEIGKGDAGPHRIGEIRRRLDPARPVRLWRRDAFGAAIVEDGV